MTTRAEYLALAERAERAEASEAAQIIREAVLLCGKEEALTLLAVGALLDAALTLVLEGYGWHAHSEGQAGVYNPRGLQDDAFSVDFVFSGNAATPALALVAAALRARAEEAKDA